MKFLPYEKYNLYTSLSIEEIRTRLRENSQRDSNLLGMRGKGDKPWLGHWRKGNRFYLNRLGRSYRENTPAVLGRCYEENGQVRIKVCIRWEDMTLLGWALIFGGSALAVVVWFFWIIWLQCSTGHVDREDFLYPGAIGGPLIFYIILLPMFEMESDMATKFLLTIFEAKKTPL